MAAEARRGSPQGEDLCVGWFGFAAARAVPAAGSGLPGLRHRVDFVFELTRGRLRRHPAAADGVPPGLVEDSRIAACALADDGPVRLVHGDLHPGNVLRAAPGGEW